MQYSIHTFGTTGLYTRDYSEQLWFPLNQIHQPQLLRVNQGKPQLQIKQLMYKYTCIYTCVRRSQANLIAKSTGCKGTYALMNLPEHNRILQTVPDAMHTVKDLIEKIVYLVTGIFIKQL